MFELDSNYPEKDSSIPPLEVPEFKSTIPAPLLKGASDGEKFVYSELSIQSEQLKYIVELLPLIHDQVRRTNGRVSKLENWRGAIMSYKVVVFAIVSFLVGAMGVVFEIYKLFHP